MSKWHKATRFSTYSKRFRPSIAATLPAPCVNRCRHGGIVRPDQAWDVGHIVAPENGGTNDRSNFGPAHRDCNRGDGGKRGAQLTNSARLAEKRRREW